MRLVADNLEQSQAANEAIEVLNRAGFIVEDFEIETESGSHTFDLDVTLSLEGDERPLQHIVD